MTTGDRHVCVGKRCSTGIPPKRYFCTVHTKLLPYPIIKALTQNPAGSDKHNEAVGAGIAYIEEKEGRG